MNTIEYNGFSYSIPATWDELDQKQFLQIAAMLRFYYSKDQLTTVEWRILREECLIILLNSKRGLFRDRPEVKNLKAMDALSQIALLNHEDILPWLFEQIELSAYLIKNLVLKGSLFFGPYADLMDVTAEEFIEAHIYSQLFESTKDDQYLISLIALLYRPQDKDYKKRATAENVADMRVKNSVFTQTEREKLFAKHLNATMKIAIYLQYCGHLDKFTKDYPGFFKQAEKHNGETADLKSYLVLIKNLSGGKFGNYNETKLQRADLFFNEVEDKIAEYNEAKRQKK